MRPMRASEAAPPSLEDSSHNSRRGGGMTITARHNLLSDLWTADVEALETAIRRFKTDRHLMNNCEVVFFELVGDGHLHVNVTHTYATKAVSGWAGPGRMPDGFVHNRTFSGTGQREMIRHVRDMVCPSRL